MELVTGYAGKAHITAVQNGAMNAGLVGSGSYVFNTGEKLSASVITNNLIRIHDGDMIANGRHITIAKGTYEEIEIANGLQGVKRNDLICARYEKNADSGIESASLVVIQGTSTEGTPDDPEYNDNNILDGTLISDFPLYRITLDGLNVGEPEQLFTVVKGINEIQDDVDALNSNLEQTNTKLDTFDLKNSSGTVLDNTTHACSGHDMTTTFDVSNMSNYRYIKVVGHCGDVSGDFYFWFTNKPTIETQFAFNIQSATYQACVKVTCNYINQKLSIQGQSIGWNITNCNIEQVVGYCPVN